MEHRGCNPWQLAASGRAKNRRKQPKTPMVRFEWSWLNYSGEGDVKTRARARECASVQ